MADQLAHASQPVRELLRIEGHILEGQQLEQQGHAVRVTVIQGGTSRNGYSYNEAALKAIARLIEGAQAYADHARQEADQQTRSVRDVVGFYHDVAYIPPSSTTNDACGRVDATLHLFEAASWLWSIIREACALGRPELIGLSIDIFGNWQLNEGTRAKEVTAVATLNSCDIVTRPSAGGSFRRIIHDISSHPHLQGEHIPMSDILSTPQSEHDGQASVAPEPASHAQPEQHIVEQQQINVMLHDLQLERAQLTLERRLLESVLPEPVRVLVRTRFQGRIFEASELDNEMNAQQEMLAALASQGLIRGNGHEKAAVSGAMISEAEKIQAAFDRMFDLDIDAARLGNIRGFASVREAYARVTGDASVAGFSERSHLGQIRVSEHAPLACISEADTTTASFSYLLGTSMNKRLLKDYQAWPAEWQRFCTIAPTTSPFSNNRHRG